MKNIIAYNVIKIIYRCIYVLHTVRILYVYVSTLQYKRSTMLGRELTPCMILASVCVWVFLGDRHSEKQIPK